jgi:hypothetical protein
METSSHAFIHEHIRSLGRAIVSWRSAWRGIDGRQGRANTASETGRKAIWYVFLHTIGPRWSPKLGGRTKPWLWWKLGSSVHRFRFLDGGFWWQHLLPSSQNVIVGKGNWLDGNIWEVDISRPSCALRQHNPSPWYVQGVLNFLARWWRLRGDASAAPHVGYVVFSKLSLE